MSNGIKVPFENNEVVSSLRAGDVCLLSGVIYSARDAAHKRMMETLDRGEELPFDIKGSIIYYLGPTPARPGHAIGSAGPTTSGRMDRYTPRLLDLGMAGMIGKGMRSPDVMDAIVRNGAVYFVAVGGAGALLSKSIVSSDVVAYEDLGTEAVRRMVVRDFPVIVGIDTKGNDVYAR
ncbi:MAG: Fe-S-containing hydro-lyase [Lachnospiraceae bacterium]|nr:Fe-S-containing hydro-lyase [Lachnospiraceae bacterium]